MPQPHTLAHNDTHSLTHSQPHPLPITPTTHAPAASTHVWVHRGKEGELLLDLPQKSAIRGHTARQLPKESTPP